MYYVEFYFLVVGHVSLPKKMARTIIGNASPSMKTPVLCSLPLSFP